MVVTRSILYRRLLASLEVVSDELDSCLGRLERLQSDDCTGKTDEDVEFAKDTYVDVRSLMETVESTVNQINIMTKWS